MAPRELQVRSYSVFFSLFKISRLAAYSNMNDGPPKDLSSSESTGTVNMTLFGKINCNFAHAKINYTCN